MTLNCLVVDDDAKIRSLLARALQIQGWQATLAASAEEAEAVLDERGPESFSVYLIDVMLPGDSGLDLVRSLREKEIRNILLLTARDAVSDRVKGLESGADDYIVKPFAMEELVARIKAVVRRDGDGASSETVGDCVWNNTSMTLTRAGEPVDLSPTERKLLQVLLYHRGKALSRNMLLDRVWGYDFGGDDNVLDVYVGYLRKKLEAEGHPRLITTVRGYGFCLKHET